MSYKANTHSNEEFPAIYLSTSQNVAIGIASVSSVATASTTTVIRVCSTVDCYISIGSSPTATATSTFLPAKLPEYFGINSGDIVAVIQSTVSGTLNISEGK